MQSPVSTLHMQQETATDDERAGGRRTAVALSAHSLSYPSVLFAFVRHSVLPINYLWSAIGLLQCGVSLTSAAAAVTAALTRSCSGLHPPSSGTLLSVSAAVHAAGSGHACSRHLLCFLYVFCVRPFSLLSATLSK
jgi:hypothetical protein